jgi:ferritin-like metal-binding protein YciE
MNVDDFRRMYVIELQELRSVEDQLVQALPRMAQLVEHPGLRQVLEAHLAETKSQRDRLDELLKKHNAGTREYQDGSMQAILREGERWAKMVSDRDCRDAGIIASAQRVEHYEMAVYGTLATWARQLGLHDDARVLHAILQEEKRADEKLSRLAEQGVNREAAEREPGQAGRSERGQMADYYDDSVRYVQAGSRAMAHQVEEQPLLAMLVAGATGYLLGYLVHGDHRMRQNERIPDYARTRAYEPRTRTRSYEPRLSH